MNAAPRMRCLVAMILLGCSLPAAAAEPEEPVELRYEKQRLRFCTTEVTRGKRGIVERPAYDRWVPCRGAMRVAVEMQPFFSEVGRIDLYERQQSRIFTQDLLKLTGLAVAALGGGYWAYRGLTADPVQQRDHLIGGAAVGAGAATIAVGLVMQLFTELEPLDLKYLVDQHNADLRTELGMEDPPYPLPGPSWPVGAEEEVVLSMTPSGRERYAQAFLDLGSVEEEDDELLRMGRQQLADVKPKVTDVPIQGTEKRLLLWEEYHLAIGDTEAANRSRIARRLSYGLLGGIGVGGGIAAVGWYRSQADSPMVYSGLAVAAASLVAALILFPSGSDRPEPEAVLAAERDYNRRLAARLVKQFGTIPPPGSNEAPEPATAVDLPESDATATVPPAFAAATPEAPASALAAVRTAAADAASETSQPWVPLAGVDSAGAAASEHRFSVWLRGGASRAQAEEAWRQLQELHAEALAGRSAEVVEHREGDDPLEYRLVFGAWASRQDAILFCAGLRKRDRTVACFSFESAPQATETP